MKLIVIEYFFMTSLQIAFIVMKLCGAISWSWWLVMLPVLYLVVINILALLLILSAKTCWARRLIKQGDPDNLLVFCMKTIHRDVEKMKNMTKRMKKQSNIE